jgi:hypothetical protein
VTSGRALAALLVVASERIPSALGPRTLELARDRASGANPYLGFAATV